MVDSVKWNNSLFFLYFACSIFLVPTTRSCLFRYLMVKLLCVSKDKSVLFSTTQQPTTFFHPHITTDISSSMLFIQLNDVAENWITGDVMRVFGYQFKTNNPKFITFKCKIVSFFNFPPQFSGLKERKRERKRKRVSIVHLLTRYQIS